MPFTFNSLPSGEMPISGCWTVIGGKELFAVFAVIVAWELGIAAISYWRTWNMYVTTGTPFWELFYKAGNHFYFWVLGISWINIALIGSSANHHDVRLIQDRIVLSLTRTVHSVCVARLLLHVRRQSSTARAFEEQQGQQEQLQSIPLSEAPPHGGGKMSLTEQASHRSRSRMSLRAKWEERKKKQEPTDAQVPGAVGTGADLGYPRFADPSSSILTLTEAHGVERASYHKETDLDEEEEGNSGRAPVEYKDGSEHSHEALLDTGSIRTLRTPENRPRSWKSYRKSSRSPRR